MSNVDAEIFLNSASAFFDNSREMRALATAIRTSLGEEWRKSMTANPSAVAELASEVMAEGDPDLLLRKYGGGGKIDDAVVGILDSAVTFAQRKRTSPKEEFEKLAKIRGLDF